MKILVWSNIAPAFLAIVFQQKGRRTGFIEVFRSYMKEE